MLWHGKNFRGIINKAKQMIFDNTGTTLQSTNAEDAIKEVNSKLTNINNVKYYDMVLTSGLTASNSMGDFYYVVVADSNLRNKYILSAQIVNYSGLEKLPEVMFVTSSIDNTSIVLCANTSGKIANELTIRVAYIEA